MSFKNFSELLTTEYGKPRGYFESEILLKMKNQVTISLQSVRSKIVPVKRSAHCFELFGYDFIIDSDFNTWLIEVNTNPCLEESSQLLKTLIPRMINDLFKLTIDKIHHY